MIDLTCDRLEQGALSLFELLMPTVAACTATDIPDNFEGFILQARHGDNLALSNDGKFPVLASYELEIVLRTADEALMARRKATGGVLKAFLSQELQNAINAALLPGESLNIIHVSTSNEETVLSESSMYDFSTTLSITCQPLIGAEE